jgi:hypothetical protein
MRSAILKNSVLVLSGLLVALVLSEIVLRIAYGDKFGRRPDFFTADKELGWRPAANLDDVFYGPDFKIAVKTDADGYRLGALGEIDYSKRLIVLCGDSYVFGWGVSTNETMASNLDELVDAASAGTMRVVNLGVGGYGTLQYYFWLMRFLKTHQFLNLAALIVVHAENDAPDNLKSLGYHIGEWAVHPRSGVMRSRSHLINFIGYTRAMVVRKRDARWPGEKSGPGINDPYRQDILFSHEYTARNRYPSEVNFGGRIVSFRNVSDDDWYVERMIERRSMTPLQRELIQVAVEFIHYMVENMSIRILHVTVPTMSDWYRAELVKLLEGSRQSEGNSVVISEEKYADPAAFGGQVTNTHSGGHYTPEFNRYWAERITQMLRRQNVLPDESFTTSAPE